MSLGELHQARREGTAPASLVDQVPDAECALYLAVWSHGLGLTEHALGYAERAVGFDATSEVARLLVRYIDAGDVSPYDSPAAFRSFIRGGGNVGLYEAMTTMLREHYRQLRPDRLLDIGVGDGSALLAAIRDDVLRVDVVEPSAGLLDKAVAGLVRRGIEHRAWSSRMQEFVREHDDLSWELIQSTFALQSLPPEDRAEVLSWSAQHTRMFVLTEFDVRAAADPFAPDWFRGCLARLERGLREYTTDRDLVGAGFILPAVLGYFRPDPTNYERPIGEWAEELRRAGFAHVRSRKLDDSWWSPAHVVTAHH